MGMASLMKKLNELKVHHSQRQNIELMEKAALEEQRRKVDIAFSNYRAPSISSK
ncbi:MAG: hypothetical protein KA771_08165 [Spirochaetales bacterium]|nr:hypothetical protein [Spirochaetales bacterium]